MNTYVGCLYSCGKKVCDSALQRLDTSTFAQWMFVRTFSCLSKNLSNVSPRVQKAYIHTSFIGFCFSCIQIGGHDKLKVKRKKTVKIKINESKRKISFTVNSDDGRFISQQIDLPPQKFVPFANGWDAKIKIESAMYKRLNSN